MDAPLEITVHLYVKVLTCLIPVLLIMTDHLLFLISIKSQMMIVTPMFKGDNHPCTLRASHSQTASLNQGVREFDDVIIWPTLPALISVQSVEKRRDHTALWNTCTVVFDPGERTIYLQQLGFVS